MTLFSIRIEALFSWLKGVNEAQKHCEAAIVLVLNVFFFVEEVFVKAFHLVMTTATTKTTAMSN